MSHGKLQQVATPREIYDAPANAFVASFVGENNILSGEVMSTAGQMATFRTPSGSFVARMGQGASGNLKMFLRPEHVRLQAEAAPLNSIPVEISDVAFEGNFVSIQSRDATGQILVAETRNDGSLIPARGDRLHMVFEARNALILSGETAAKDVDA